MPFSTLYKINGSIAAEHQAWLYENSPSSALVEFLKGRKINYALAENEGDEATLQAADVVSGWIDLNLGLLGKGDKKENVRTFKKSYRQFQEALQQRQLYLSLQQTLLTLDSIISLTDLLERTGAEKEFYQRFDEMKQFVQECFSPVHLPTRDAVLKIHGVLKIEYFKKLRAGCPSLSLQLQLDQLEQLSEQWLRGQYENAKKETSQEFVQNKAAAASTSFGLLTGIGAIILWCVGIAHPAVWIGATALSSVSYVSLASTAIEAYQMIKNYRSYDYKPTRKEIALLAVDIVITGLSFGAGSLAKSAMHFAKSAAHAASPLRLFSATSKAITGLWNNVVSNVTDLPYAKESGKESISLFRRLRDWFYLKQTLTATSFSSIRQALSQKTTASQTLKAVNTIKEEIRGRDNGLSAGHDKQSKVPLDTARSGRDFSYLLMPSKKGEEGREKLEQYRSYHAHIMTYKLPGTAKEIKKALGHYRQLSPDAKTAERYNVLMSIKLACADYLNQDGIKEKTKQNVQSLYAISNTELETIKAINQTLVDNEIAFSEAPVLVGHKQYLRR